MSNQSGGFDILGVVSIVFAIIGLFGQPCCCLPIISLLAMFVIPVCILVSLVTGTVGVGLGMASDRSSALSWMGLLMGLFDIAFLCLWYGTFICGYLGLATAAGLAEG